MNYENSSRKTVLVLNTEFPAPMLMNAIGHSILGLAAKGVINTWNMLEYPGPGFDVDSRISEYPVVVLRAKKSTQLEKLVQQINAAGIISNVFIDTMIGRNAAEQQQATRDALPGKDRVVCVALFGEEEILRPLIKSYSVYKITDAIQDTGSATAAAESVKA
jgi:hypothetical protein